MFLSSDCMVPKFGVKEAKKCGQFYWLATVMDQATNLMYVCEKKPIPLHFFSSCLKKHVEAIGGFDEEYLRGMAHEDNDFGARLGLHCGQALIANNVLVTHQSHEPLAYSDGHYGLHVNEAYTLKKWGGVPWRDMDMRDPVSLETCHDGKVLRVTPSLGGEHRPSPP
jgi:GT2 family glycosyltransferase